MSVSQTTEADSDLPPKARRLATYLRLEVADADGELYVKSKFLADDLALSPQEIGAAMRTVREEASDLRVEKWAYSSATTWRVTAT